MKTIVKGKFLLTVFVLSLVANATASEFIYKPASPTVAAVKLQKVEGGHLERFQKPFQIQRLSENVYWVSVSYYNVTVVVGKETVLLIDAPYRERRLYRHRLCRPRGKRYISSQSPFRV